MRWLTRERVLIDRVACPWLIRRFIDPQAEFLYGPEQELRALAVKHEATLYDVKDADVERTHVGSHCSHNWTYTYPRGWT